MRDSSRLWVRAWQLGILAASVGAWEGLVRAGVLDEFFFSRPSAILGRVQEWFAEGAIYRHLWVTLAEVVAAFLLATVLAVVLGLWLALVPAVAQILDPYIKAFNSLPRVILAPIFTLWFGLGMLSKIALGMTLVFFVAFFNTYQGVREVNPAVIANARMLGAQPGHLLWHVYLPAAASWILSSLRASIGFAVVGAVVGEYLGSAVGLGYVIAQAEGVFDATGVFAGMAVLATFVLLLDQAVSTVERRLLVWHPARGAEGRQE